MRLRFYSSVYTVVMGLLLSNCQFILDEENFVTVSNVALSTISVDLNELGDTIQLVQPLNINYNISFPKDVRYVLTVTIGDQPVHQSQSVPGSFEISPFQFPEGFYQFKMQVITSSGTNSLADQLGYEGVLFEIEKVVWVEKSPAQKINITAAECMNGNLVIQWEKYPKINLQKYLLYKRVQSEDGRELTLSELYTIEDRNQTTFTDPTYIGGKATYYIVTQVTTSSNTAEGDPFYFESERPKIKEFSTIGEELEIRWSKPKFYNAFQKYWLRKTGDYANPYFQSGNINDTTFLVNNLGFGKSIEVELNTVPVLAHSGGGPSTALYSTYQDVFLGEAFPNHQAVFSNATTNLVYYYTNGFIYVTNRGESIPYDSIQLTLNGSVDRRLSFALSRNGEYLYVGSNNMLIQLNPVTLEVINSQPLSDIVSINELYPFAIAVGNQNLISVDVKVPEPLYQNGFVSNFIAIIDGNTFTVTDTIMTKNDILTLTGNENLTYLYENNTSQRRLFEINLQGEEIRRKNFGTQIMGEGYFLANKFYAYMWSKKWIIDLTTFTIIQENPILDWLYNLSIDPVTGEVTGVNSDGYFLSYTFDTMQELKRLKLYSYALNDINQYYNRITYCNGILYSGIGFKLQIN